MTSKTKAIVIPALIGLVSCVIATQVHHSYGLSLFLVLPFLLPMLSAVILKKGQDATFGQCYWTSFISISLLGLCIIAMALDGIICLLMALPLTMLLMLPGVGLGCFLANKLSRRFSDKLPLLILIGFPLLVGFEEKLPKRPTTHQVVTTIEVDAPIQRVWDEVVAFEKITTPPTGVFKLGIAYPIEARIEGRGVGAVRYCVFSTGPFVEPITKWEEPNLLCFDVASSPSPMDELSPWGKITTPHLQNAIVSQRGQFKLTERKGKTILEGTTWYHQNIYPDVYWSQLSSTIIHWIHLRVLNHIKLCAERA